MELLTIAEIAKRLNHPESTVRSWRNRYDAWIPSVGSGRKKRYKPEAVRVFAVIAESVAEERSFDDIAERLTADFPRSIDYRKDNSSDNAASTTMALYTPTTALQRMIEGQDLLIRALADQAARQAEMDAMRQEIRELRQLVEDQKQAAAPWYKRIGRRTRQDKKTDTQDAD